MKVGTEVALTLFGAARNRIATDSLGLELAVPVLAGDTFASLSLDLSIGPCRDGWQLWESKSAVYACCAAPIDGSLEATARRVYREAFEITGDRKLYRFWNYVPSINVSVDGLENYRSFGLGRYKAFVDRFGPRAQASMPAATGVGSDGDSLVVCVLAGRCEPTHFENPNQTPAYCYPDDYGPRPPSFARGTTISFPGKKLSFLAGTASVVGHVSVGIGNLDHQIEVTLANLESLGTRMQLGRALGRGCGLQRSFRIYLRDPENLSRAQQLLDRKLLESGDAITWLRSDLCRSDLDIEVEATLTAKI